MFSVVFPGVEGRRRRRVWVLGNELWLNCALPLKKFKTQQAGVRHDRFFCDDDDGDDYDDD